MAENPANILIGKTGSVFTAPVGTTAPSESDPLDELDAAFVNVGLITRDGVKRAQTVTELITESWQNVYPTRRDVTGRDMKISFAMQEWNPEAVILGLGGGSIVGGVYRPPSPGDRDPRAMVVNTVDGDKHYRLYIPQGSATDAIETDWHTGGAALLPVGFNVEAVQGEDPFLIITDDPSWLLGS